MDEASGSAPRLVRPNSVVGRTESGKGSSEGYPLIGCLSIKEMDEIKVFTPLVILVRNKIERLRKKSGSELSFKFVVLREKECNL